MAANIISGTPDIKIIQGDTYTKQIKFTNVDYSLIEYVYFSCKILNITKKLDKLDDGVFQLYFLSAETKLFPVISGNYDLTVKFVDTKINTIVYNETITILAKSNEVDEDGDIIQEKSLDVTENNLYEIVPDEGKLLSKVTINVNVPITGKQTELIQRTITSLSPNDFEGCTFIGANAFANCESLQRAEIPDNITDISLYAFSGCNSLTSVKLPETLTHIGTNCFSNCTFLAELTVPASVQSIDARGLSCGYTTNKATITMKSATPPTISSSTFLAQYLKNIIVPIGAGETYKSATNWSAFADYIIEGNV